MEEIVSRAKERKLEINIGGPVWGVGLGKDWGNRVSHVRRAQILRTLPTKRKKIYSYNQGSCFFRGGGNFSFEVKL